MSKVLNREQSGNFAESLVFYKLLSLGYVVKFATKNQRGYDLTIERQNNQINKIEVKHIQYTGSSSSDSFKLSRNQAENKAFDFLILVISDCSKNQHISKINFYVFTYPEINSILDSKNKAYKNSKSSIPRNYTFNLNSKGDSLAGNSLKKHFSHWGKI